MPAHVRSILTNMDLTVPVSGGRCAWGPGRESISTSTAPTPIAAK